MREGNSVLRHPTHGIDARGNIPHRIPVQVLAQIVGGVDVFLDAARIHGESDRGAPIVVRIDDEMHPVGVNPGGVATGELCGNRVRMRIEHSDPDVQRGVVVEHPRLRLIRSPQARCWITLREAGCGRSFLPIRLIELAVEMDLTGSAYRLYDPSGSGVGSWQRVLRDDRSRSQKSDEEDESLHMGDRAIGWVLILDALIPNNVVTEPPRAAAHRPSPSSQW